SVELVVFRNSSIVVQYFLFNRVMRPEKVAKTLALQDDGCSVQYILDRKLGQGRQIVLKGIEIIRGRTVTTPVLARRLTDVLRD
ncbi:hypothetical protein HHI36_009013, partial [Cryptolaemus montrouzieri]